MIKTQQALHYAWVVAGVGALATFCALGLARFAFGMLLPSMSASLALDYSQRGVLGFGYLAGYLVAVAMVPFIVSKLGARKMISGCLSLVALSLFGIAITKSFLLLCLLYALTGIGSGGTLVPAMSLASQWFYPSHRGMASGLLMSGTGLGIIASGFIVPQLKPFLGLLAWQTGWLIFAVVTSVGAVLTHILIRNHPRDIGETPFGQIPEASVVGKEAKPPLNKVRLIAHLGLIFAIYGATYMLYVTFIVTSMVDAYKLSEADAGGIWAWFGFVSIFSGILFGRLSDRIGRRAGLSVAFSFLALAYFLVAVNTRLPGLYASIVLFGLAAWSVPVIMSAAAGDYFGSAGAANGLALLVLIFSVGQALGPVMAGFMADMTGDFSASYAASGAVALLAIFLSMMLKAPPSLE